MARVDPSGLWEGGAFFVSGAAVASCLLSPVHITASAIEWLANLQGFIEHRSIARPHRFVGLEVPDFDVAARLLSAAGVLPPALQILLDRELECGRRLHRQILQRF